jgi:hypothetical protein
MSMKLSLLFAAGVSAIVAGQVKTTVPDVPFFSRTLSLAPAKR